METRKRGDGIGVVSRESDLKRLRRELETLLESLQQDLEESQPQLSRRQRLEQARSKLLALVDEAVRDVTSG